MSEARASGSEGRVRNKPQRRVTLRQRGVTHGLAAGVRGGRRR